ncbi:carbon-nitrogen hydrolase family protein [Candidatus Izemoplasma sp. B36]|uniref:carbon-nitrogen hydrolase family protein n=1 Tax=Candidatus Izemoplasma sp. B36 TaxID=3242468 RepID=UPI003557814E
MKIGIYQFANTGQIQKNLQIMTKACKKAYKEGCRLIVFPECALTGYPPIEVNNIKNIDFEYLEEAERKLCELAKEGNIYLMFGTIRKQSNQYYNSIKCVNPSGKVQDFYDKKAIWGYDLNHFTKGTTNNIFKVDNIRVGIAICFEIRFPEFYRSFVDKADLMVTFFSDVSEKDSIGRYQLIESHIITRAVENVLPHIAINSSTKYQTAPTGVYDIYGRNIVQATRNKNQLIIYNYEKIEHTYGSLGRYMISMEYKNKLTRAD